MQTRLQRTARVWRRSHAENVDETRVENCPGGALLPRTECDEAGVGVGSFHCPAMRV